MASQPNSVQINPVPVNPGRIHQALTSYQLAMALKGAIDLEVFTHIAAGATTSDAIAPLCHGTEKGVRVLCDYLTVHGFLTKAKGAYGLAPDTAALLDKNSPSYMGSVAEFFTHPVMVNKYRDVAALVRNGGATTDHTLAPNDNVWVEFARYMAPMFALPASIVATHVTTPASLQRFWTSQQGTACSASTLHSIIPPPSHFPGLGKRS